MNLPSWYNSPIGSCLLTYRSALLSSKSWIPMQNKEY